MTFNFNDFLQNNPNFSYDMVIDEAYSRLYETMKNEADEEIKQYNEWLLDKLQETIQYIHQLEKKIRQ